MNKYKWHCVFNFGVHVFIAKYIFFTYLLCILTLLTIWSLTLGWRSLIVAYHLWYVLKIHDEEKSYIKIFIKTCIRRKTWNLILYIYLLCFSSSVYCLVFIPHLLQMIYNLNTNKSKVFCFPCRMKLKRAVSFPFLPFY